MLTPELLTILDARIRAAGIPIVGIDGNGVIEFAPGTTQPQRDQAAAIVAAFDAVAEEATYLAAMAGERVDLHDLLPKITTELSYITTTLGTIDTMTAAQVRDVVKRLLLEQQAELKAWRYVIRSLVGL